MSIDPSVQMAVSIHSRKGVYALLLGSGISSAARIPTGWDITLDLVRQVAAANQKTQECTDPEAWYRAQYGEPPNYSSLLALLAKTPEERALLLKKYFEPDEDERADGLKQPTEAHKAIARLVVGGYIRIIITTNFDRLMEQALEAVGLNPTVVASEPSFAGMMPLPHVNCLIVKLHGDYLNTPLLNTPSELETYPDALNLLLDRLLSEYGLILSGWSGEWDEALRNAILRNTRFRFSTFWMSRGELGMKTRELVTMRSAEEIRITDADSAFTLLANRVEAIADQRLADPTSQKVAIATMKRLLADPIRRIQLEDFVVAELNRVIKAVGEDAMPTSGPQLDATAYCDRVRRIAAACSNLIPMVSLGVRYGDQSLHPIWRRCLDGLSRQPIRQGGCYDDWKTLQRLAMHLLLYSMMISAIQNGDYALIHSLTFDAGHTDRNHEVIEFKERCPIDGFMNKDFSNHLHSPVSNRKTPGSDWALGHLQNELSPVLGADLPFETMYDYAEFVLFLIWYDATELPASARFAWKQFHHSEQGGFVARIRSELGQMGNSHPMLVAGMFKKIPVNLKKALDAAQKLTNMRFW